MEKNIHLLKQSILSIDERESAGNETIIHGKRGDNESRVSS